jgi:outer membrane protein assembly factor BamB
LFDSGSDDGSVYGLSPTLREFASFVTGMEVDTSPAIGNDGTVYIGGDTSYLYALDPNYLNLNWKYDTDGTSPLHATVGV